MIDAYEKVRPNLLRHDPWYPAADVLREVVKPGQPVAGPEIAVERCVGDGKDTEASDWLIRVVDRPDPRPVWVVVWGGSTDLAQVLWEVRRGRSADDLRAFLGKLRVLTIGDQDSTGPWIREQFPNIPHTLMVRGYRGMYRGGDPAFVSSGWVGANIHGHGPLGDLDPDYNGGDIWSGQLGRVRGIKEGDTPSFLALAPNGLTELDRPWLGSWGGIFEGEANRRTDVPDPGLAIATDPDPRVSSVHRWRPAFQADFQARLDWCVKPFAECNRLEHLVQRPGHLPQAPRRRLAPVVVPHVA